MLLIEQSQIDALKRVPIARFEQQMCEHVHTYFPNHCRIAGDQAVKILVSHATVQAQSYGFITQRDCCLYLTSMFMLGTHFDIDPMYPWVAAYLNSTNVDEDFAPDSEQALEPIADRGGALADKSLAFLQEYAGKERRHINRCILYLHNNPNNMIAPTNNNSQTFEHLMLEHLSTVFPSKVEAFGEPLINLLIENGCEMALKYGLTETAGKSLLITMMLLLGSAIDNDPFIPWVKEILNDENIHSQTIRVTTLQARMTDFIEQWLVRPDIN